MKIEKVMPVIPAYTLTLTEEEILALRACAGVAGIVETAVKTGHPMSLKTDGRVDLVRKTLIDIWNETNKFVDDWKRRL
jgi:hypothetical protein